MRVALSILLLVATAALLGSVLGCANANSNANVYYRGGTVHSNTWPGTYGRAGGVYVGRPGRYRY
jgi:cytochrome c biogenesis protein ResB